MALVMKACYFLVDENGSSYQGVGADTVQVPAGTDVADFRDAVVGKNKDGLLQGVSAVELKVYERRNEITNLPECQLRVTGAIGDCHGSEETAVFVVVPTRTSSFSPLGSTRFDSQRSLSIDWSNPEAFNVSLDGAFPLLQSQVLPCPYSGTAVSNTNQLSFPDTMFSSLGSTNVSSKKQPPTMLMQNSSNNNNNAFNEHDHHEISLMMEEFFGSPSSSTVSPSMTFASPSDLDSIKSFQTIALPTNATQNDLAVQNSHAIQNDLSIHTNIASAFALSSPHTPATPSIVSYSSETQNSKHSPSFPPLIYEPQHHDQQSHFHQLHHLQQQSQQLQLQQQSLQQQERNLHLHHQQQQQQQLHSPTDPSISLDLIVGYSPKSFSKTCKITKKARKCSFCAKICSNNSSLKSHILTHTKERPFACTVCPSTYTTNSRLKLHMMSHTKEYPFPCMHAECEFNGRTKWELRRHCSAKHPGLDIIL
ncbi:UNVERIFIED_CONTAM: hypothetical protein HDU68_002594 [Siphonaria sp. JEL0065]|nr:hypothetical protein HDU68_002594 [Siphonaria sp. JEL0065]